MTFLLALVLFSAATHAFRAWQCNRALQSHTFPFTVVVTQQRTKQQARVDMALAIVLVAVAAWSAAFHFGVFL